MATFTIYIQIYAEGELIRLTVKWTFDQVWPFFIEGGSERFSRLWICASSSSQVPDFCSRRTRIRVGVNSCISSAASGPLLVMTPHLFCILFGCVSRMLWSDVCSSWCYLQLSCLCVSHISHCLAISLHTCVLSNTPHIMHVDIFKIILIQSLWLLSDTKYISCHTKQLVVSIFSHGHPRTQGYKQTTDNKNKNSFCEDSSS